MAMNGSPGWPKRTRAFLMKSKIFGGSIRMIFGRNSAVWRRRRDPLFSSTGRGQGREGPLSRRSPRCQEKRESGETKRIGPPHLSASSPGNPARLPPVLKIPGKCFAPLGAGLMLLPCSCVCLISFWDLRGWGKGKIPVARALFCDRIF